AGMDSFFFLYKPVGQACDVPAVKEIEDAILNRFEPCTQFVNPVSKKVTSWPAQLETKLFEPLNAFKTLDVCLMFGLFKIGEPIYQRSLSRLIPKNKQFS